MAPESPWLAAEVAGLAYVRRLGAPWMGAREVVRALLGEEVGFSVAEEKTRAAFGYLLKRRGELSRAESERLARAPLWRSEAGHLRRLSELRRPSSSEGLRALYRAWPVGEVIDAEGESSSLVLAQGLELDGALQGSGVACLLDDLVARGAPPEALRPLWVEALNEAPQEVPARELARVMGAALFRAEGAAGCVRLEGWEDTPRGGARRASGALREALRGSVPLLAAEDEEELAPLLRALPARPATLEDLAHWIESGRLSESAVPAARAALVGGREALARWAAKRPGRASALALWPTRGGALRPASQVVRTGELAEALGPRWREEGLPAALEGALLSPEAEPDAEALRGVVSFLAPVEVLTARLHAEAREGEPLSAQSAWLAEVGAVVKVAALLARHLAPEALCELPLSVDAAGRLVRGRRFGASPEEQRLCAGLPLFHDLALPDWSEAARGALPEKVVAALCPALPARRVLGGLAEHARHAVAAEEHPTWRDPETRQALYRWLLARAEEIEADEQALGVAGRACFILSAGGSLRSPRELLFDEGLPDIGLDWDAAGEVPRPLCAWLRRAYRVEERRLAQIVARLLEAHKEAASTQDGTRSQVLLRALSRALAAAPGGLPALAERFSLSRHLKVEDQRGQFQRVRRLLSIDTERWSLLEACCEALPARLSPRYQDPDTLALLRAAGAPQHVEAEALAPLLRGEGRKEGLAPLLALARYVSLLVIEDPAQQHALQLDRAAWLPDGDGAPRPPSALYWPTPEARALLGEEPSRYPHPEVALTVPESITQRLRFRRPEDAPLDDVLPRLRDGEPAPPELLRWLDEGLRTRRIEAAALRLRLSGLRVFLDEDGTLRPFSQLLRVPARELFGRRRGYYPEGRRAAHLADALGIASSLGAREFAAFYEEVARDLARLGSSTLQAQEPELVNCLLRLLSRLAERAARPDTKRLAPSVLVAEAARGEVMLAELQHPRLRLPLPAEEAHAAKNQGLWLVVLPSENPEEAAALLRPDVAPISEAAREAAPRRPNEIARAPQAGAETPPAPPTRAPQAGAEAPPRPPNPPTDPEAPRGLLARLRRWASGGEPPEETPREVPRASSPGTPRAAAPPPTSDTGRPLRPDGTPADSARPHRDWFRPRGAIDPQLRSANAWLDDRARAPEFGFSFAPRSLPLPYRYAPQLVANRLDPRTQRWSPGRPDSAWSRTEGPIVAQVSLRGRVPAGESQLPVPLYASVGALDAPARAHRYSAQTGQEILSSPTDADAALTLSLHAPPEFSEAPAPEAPREFLDPTVPDEELPAEVLSWVESARRLTARARTVEVREFIRERYRYDPTYLEDERAARWLRGVTQGKANAHVAALHAWRDTQHLGRGVCYELNALACELLRRVGVPAAIATGWTFERGALSEPDHLWAMALLPSDRGPRWFPVDAATTRDGRPLRVSQRPQGAWRSPAQANQAPSGPAWEKAGPRVLQEIPPTAELLRVARYLAGRNNAPAPDSDLRQRCYELLEDPVQARRLLDLLRRDE